MNVGLLVLRVLHDVRDSSVVAVVSSDKSESVGWIVSENASKVAKKLANTDVYGKAVHYAMSSGLVAFSHVVPEEVAHTCAKTVADMGRMSGTQGLSVALLELTSAGKSALRAYTEHVENTALECVYCGVLIESKVAEVISDAVVAAKTMASCAAILDKVISKVRDADAAAEVMYNASQSLGFAAEEVFSALSLTTLNALLCQFYVEPIECESQDMCVVQNESQDMCVVQNESQDMYVVQNELKCNTAQ